MKYFVMLFLVGTFVAAISAAPHPCKCAAAQDDEPNMRSAKAVKAVLQALLNAERQNVFEQDEDDNGLEQDEDDGGDLMAALESLSDKAQAQLFGGLIKSLLG